MKHASTRAVFAYWNERRGKCTIPARGDIDPAAIPLALGDAVMLAADFNDELRFRLAGTRVCGLFGREIKGEAFSALWSDASSMAIANLVTALTSEKVGAVSGVTGRTADGEETNLELLMLPLAQSGNSRVRALGALAALIHPYWLGEKPIIDLTLDTLRHIGADLENRSAQGLLFRHALASRRRHGFVVYSGGRDTPSGERTG